MKCTVFSVLALALSAAAVPSEISPRELQARKDCNNNGGAVFCCNGFIGCLLSLGGCRSGPMCCGVGNHNDVSCIERAAPARPSHPAQNACRETRC